MAIESSAFQVLALGDIRPSGWLRSQLELQADGMAGHLDEFWPDIADSAWIGGAAEGWERAPYWLDALVPLAVLLDDDRLLGKVDRWIGYIVDHQDSDGWMGPHKTDHDPYDVWPRMVLLKVLLQHHSRFADDRILSAALRLSRRIDEILAQWPLKEWGRVRWADLVYSLDRLYELTDEDWLLAAAERVKRQGYDWAGYTPSRHKVTDEELQQFRAAAGDLWMNDAYLSTHGVNVAMGLKAFPVWSRRGEERWQRPAFDRLLAQLDEFHGQPTGLFSADEHLAGTSPAQGTETCAVVEYLFSLATAVEIWGPDESLLERWERIAFNALPASARPNERGHQYDQQANQVVCHVTEDRVYTNNGPDANIFGLAPHFGCCTANRHQGWPKFAARLWLRPTAGGLAALAYAPCQVDTTVDGRPVRIDVAGNYPFTDRVTITVEGSGEFPLQLRIPGWAEGASVLVDGTAVAAEAGTMLTLHHDWNGRHRIELTLPAGVRADIRADTAVAINRGPLVFALAIEEDWRQIGGEEPYGDWEVHPAGAWNYSLAIDPDAPDLTELTSTMDGPPFTVAGAPIRLRGRATQIPQWTLEHGAAAPPPTSPCPGEGAEQEVTLLPYGAARLRVTEIPWHRPR